MTYEYQCVAGDCRAVIELIQVRSSDRKDDIPCPHCGGRADFKISAAAVSRVGMTSQPFDVAVGRDSETRWGILNKRKADRDKIRAANSQVGLAASGYNEFHAISDAQRKARGALNKVIERTGHGRVNEE